MKLPGTGTAGDAVSGPVVSGTVVPGTINGTVVVSGTVVSDGAESAASGYPPLSEIASALEHELGLSGPIDDVVAAACEQLSIDATGLGLVERGRRAYDAVCRRAPPEAAPLVVTQPAPEAAPQPPHAIAVPHQPPPPAHGIAVPHQPPPPAHAIAVQHQPPPPFGNAYQYVPPRGEWATECGKCDDPASKAICWSVICCACVVWGQLYEQVFREPGSSRRIAALTGLNIVAYHAIGIWLFTCYRIDPRGIQYVIAIPLMLLTLKLRKAIRERDGIPLRGGFDNDCFCAFCCNGFTVCHIARHEFGERYAFAHPTGGVPSEAELVREQERLAAAEVARPGALRVRVAMLSGADAEVRIDPLDTLAQLKMKIHARQGVHPRDQVLTHNGAQLRADGMTMQALGIADGARLHLVITDISPC